MRKRFGAKRWEEASAEGDLPSSEIEGDEAPPSFDFCGEDQLRVSIMTPGSDYFERRKHSNLR